MVYQLVAYNTDQRYPNDIRYREYTSSKKKADLFCKISKIQFPDSGHGIVFQAWEHKGRHKPTVHEVSDYVYEQLNKIKESKDK